jgi:hypothetical protein
VIPSRAPEIAAPMIPVGIVAESIAVKSGPAEIAETVKIL